MKDSKMWLFTLFCFTVYCSVMQFANSRPVTTIPKSCLDHLKDGIKTNGHYSVADINGKTVTVYCDFTSEPGSAWTLVASWAFENNMLPAFRTQPLTENAPVNERTPNWAFYRLSKPQMTFLKSQSTHWRATCSFENWTVDYTDYVRGSVKDLDITAYLGDGECKKIEFINIRGHTGYNITVPFWQMKNSHILHTDSAVQRCQFDGRNGAAVSEDNFGHYGGSNSRFRCTSAPTATTQYWFGGYL